MVFLVSLCFEQRSMSLKSDATRTSKYIYIMSLLKVSNSIDKLNVSAEDIREMTSSVNHITGS